MEDEGSGDESGSEGDTAPAGNENNDQEPTTPMDMDSLVLAPPKDYQQSKESRTKKKVPKENLCLELTHIVQDIRGSGDASHDEQQRQ